MMLSACLNRICCRLCDKAEPKLAENLQKGTEIRRAFSRFNTGNRRMRETTEVCEIPLRKIEVVAAFNHCSNNLRNGFNFINVFSNYRIGFSDMVFIIIPICHAVSPLSGNPVISLCNEYHDLQAAECT